MAQLPIPNFNANDVDPSSGVGPDPEFVGWHKFHITDSENKIAKSGRGEYLQLVAEVLEGKFRGCKLWIRLNLVNENQTAVEIAYRELSAICHATGVMQVTDSVQLHNKPFMINVTYKPATEKTQGGNEANGYKACDGAAPIPSQAPAPSVAQASGGPQPAAASVPPWAKKSA